MSFCSRAEGARLEKGWRMGCRSSAFVYSHVRCCEQSCSRSALECLALRVRQRDEQFALSFEGLRAVRGANVVCDQKIAGPPRLMHRVYRVDLVDRLHVRGSGNSAAIDVRLTTPRHDQVHPSRLYAVAGIGEALEVLSGGQAISLPPARSTDILHPLILAKAF
jgi:hypothetical protein